MSTWIYLRKREAFVDRAFPIFWMLLGRFDNAGKAQSEQPDNQGHIGSDVIVYAHNARYRPRMFAPRTPLLAALRRSTRLAAFALVVFVFRLGLVAACAPGDLAESLASSGGDPAVHLSVEGDQADLGGIKAHDSGHCLHCGCHVPAALPTAIVAQLLSLPISQDRQEAHSPPDAHVWRELRPPIA